MTAVSIPHTDFSDFLQYHSIIQNTAEINGMIFINQEDADIIQGQLKRLQERHVPLSQDLTFFFIQAMLPQHH